MSSMPPVLDPETLKSPRPYAGKKWSVRGDPVWELALMRPRQGEWTEEEYLRIEETEFVELVDGCLEFLPMPTLFHQRIALFLRDLLNEHLKRTRTKAEVGVAPCPVKLWPLHAREPDVFVLMPGRVTDAKRPPNGADLVAEIVSEGAEARQRDLVDKRRDYARAGVQEYWIVDPEAETITVLALGKKRYRLHGEFESGDTATSVLLGGFSVSVAAVFAAGRGRG
jgi:Uma2 family endonuclease